MDKGSVEVLLKDWQDKMLDLDKETNKLAKKIESGVGENFHESRLVYAMDKLGESYTLALAAATGIPHGLLVWYAYDNYFGKDKLVWKYGLLPKKPMYKEQITTIKKLMKLAESLN